MQKLKMSTITLGTCIRFFCIAILIVFVVAYVQFQARNIILGPSIILNDAYTPLQHEQRITLTGSAKNIVELTLNGREIHTNETGEFTQMLILENGYSIMELRAHDRFGRTTSLQRQYVYIPKTT